MHECVAKGNLRIKGWNSTNPLAVGDRVGFLPQNGTEEVGSIMDLHDRTNYLVRRSVNLSHHKHVIAANVDQLLVLVTIARPRTSFGFIDRMLVTAEAYQIPAVIVINKIDDLDKDEEERLFDMVDIYQQAGYRVAMTAALKGKGVKEIIALLAGRVTLLAGHSGVGKSTLINAIDPALDLWTLEISEASEKGMHTTTFAEMFELLPGTFIIDTPGIKDLGLVDIKEQELSHYFPEMRELINQCRFNNCKHLNEPGCAVLRALEEGHIDEGRYINYLSMLRNEDIHH